MIWFILLACSYAYGQEKVPKILKDADDFHGYPNTFSFLKVQTNIVEGAKYHWLKDGKKIVKETQPPFEIFDQTRLFAGPQASNDYAGIYQFVMTTPAGNITGRKVTVEFTYNGKFDASVPKNGTQDVVIGQANYIPCPKHSPGSNIIYKWGGSGTIGGTKFMEGKPNYIVLDDGTLFYSHLTTDNVNEFNKNKWVCGMEAKVKENSQFKWAEKVTRLDVANTNLTEFGPKIVTKLPQNKGYEEGDTISMKCAAAGRPTPVYSWKRVDVYGKEFVVKHGKDGITFEDGDARLLVIKTATRDHAGHYFCIASIGNKNDTVKGNLTFEIQPRWASDERIEDVKPSIFSRHSWTCNATGFPMPTYKWYKDGKLLVNSAARVINGGTLTFPRLQKTDTGMYECVAQNSLNNIYQTAHLDVQAEKPSFDSNTGTATLFLGSKGVIKCHAKAAPAAKNTWTKDGVNIDFSLSRYTLENDEDLVIDSVSKQDIGNYSCTAKNLYGEDDKKIRVQVVGEITFIVEPRDVVKTRGSTVALGCEAEGDKESPIKTAIKYKWEYNGKDIKLLNDTILWSDSSHLLVLINAQVTQSGSYECIAYIDQPSYAEKRRKAEVTIRGPPEPPNKVAIDGDCNGFSAKVKWSIGGKNAESIKYFVVEYATTFLDVWKNISERIPAINYEKNIDNLSPWTSYRFRVLAVNEIGTSAPSEPTLFHHCKTPQKEPTICPKIKAKGGNKAEKLTLEWTKMETIDRNGENFAYKLVYSSSNPKSSATKTFKPHELNFEIPDAGYYRLWNFKIQGVNDIGGGPYCEGSSYSGQNAPNKSPSEFKVKDIGEAFVDLQWNEVSLDKGNVDGYKLSYYHGTEKTKSRRSISADNCEARKPCERVIVGSSTTSVRVEGLIPYTEYKLALLAYNSGGNGPKSEISAMTDDSLPGAPSSVSPTRYAKFIKLEWAPPKRPNGLITGYRIAIDKDAKPREAVLSGATRKYVFGGLVPNKEYILEIQARTRRGYGEKRVVSVTTVSPRIPSTPKAPKLRGVGENGVNVTFVEGKPEKGFPEKFIVMYRVKDAKDKSWKETDPIKLFGTGSKPYAVINGLDKDKVYEMATIAVNEKGRSDMSDIKVVKPGESSSAPQSNPVYKRSWFVAIVVIVCVLLIILLIALMVTRKRGERYPVGKREKKRAGILDVGEELDNSTYPMKPARVNGNGFNRQDSGNSLPNKDPDRDSLDEYGEDRFDEDAASLIGEYNDDRKHSKRVEKPEFV